VSELLFAPPLTRQHILRHAIMQATRTAARRREDVKIVREIPPWARPLRRAARYKGSSGGRASGKSHFFAEEAVEAMVADPALRFLCIREVQSSLKFSAKSLVEAKIRELGVEHLFHILGAEIRHADGTGVMIFEGMKDHTADSIKSLEGFGRAWVEEAQSISKRSLDLLLPTIRAEGSEIWFSWNPELASDRIDQLFKTLGLEHPGVAGDFVRVHATYRDNPYCPAVMHDEAARLLAVDADAHSHIWGGGYFLGGHGRVYSSFRNKPFPEGNVDESVVDTGGDIYVGQDFNVNPMASVLGNRVVDELHVFDSLELPVSNTAEVAEIVKGKYPGRRIIFCPDPAGNQRSTKTTIVGQTDFTILRDAGFEVRAPAAHPAVVDRVNNAQEMLLKDGRRRVRISPKALTLITALANLTYREGSNAPDKKSGFDHSADAFGYLLWQEFNVLTPAWSQVRVAS
jgi:hypothetical protein